MSLNMETVAVDANATVDSTPVVTQSSNDWSRVSPTTGHSQTFTNRWFENNEKLWKVFFNETTLKLSAKEEPGAKKLRVLEIGCFEGRSTTWFLENLPENTEVHVIDTFKGSIEHSSETIGNLEDRFDTNMRPWLDQGRLRKHKGNSFDVLTTLLYQGVEKFDIIYIDGDHSQVGVISDAVLTWNLLKANGLLLFDDYVWEMNISEPRIGSQPLLGQMPFNAINFFIQAYWPYIDVLFMGSQCLIRGK